MRFVATVIAALLLTAGAALIAGAALTAPKAKKPEPKPDPAAQCAPLEPLLDKARAAGVEFEHITDSLAVLKIASVIQRGTDKPFPVPTSIIVVFVGEDVHIGIVVHGKVCTHISGEGQASSVRGLLKAVHGISIKSYAI